MNGAKPKQFSPEWWQNKDVSIAWAERFCAPFYEQDPTLESDSKTHESIGIVFSNQRNGDIVPVGITALQHGNFVFQYHPKYLENDHYPAIAYTLPKQRERFESHGEMLSFFDNLPAEGWFGKAQGLALGDEGCLHSQGYDPHGTQMDGETLESRYHRFMMFGRDYPGAVWVTYRRLDPKMAEQSHQATIEAALRSRASISGMQPKLLGVEKEDGLHAANYWETSTHIVKLPAAGRNLMPDLMEYEYMSIIATKALLPHDKAVDAKLTNLKLSDTESQPVLAIRRFDRTPEGFKRHFEEINQLMGQQNSDRYYGAYADAAKVIGEKVGHEGVKQFYGRLLCQFLLGNTDNHLKNFALLHDRRGDRWELAPDYDLAPTANYGKSDMALFVTRHRGGIESKEKYGNLTPKHLVNMGLDFGLDFEEIRAIAHGLVDRIGAAKEVVMQDPSPRLDTRMKHVVKHNYKMSKDTIREDFCDRLDGRAKQLFGTLDKYIDIQKQRQGSGRNR